MSFDLARATALWRAAIERDDWRDRLHILRIAALAGTGVLSVDAVEDARARVRADARRIRRDTVQPDPVDTARQWAEIVRTAAERHPVPPGTYPIREPADHVVGRRPCFGRARTGDWTHACMRAAWGNIEPYGLHTAVKRCPRCKREMRYWCQRRRGDEADYRWTVDHAVAHAAGGCVCHFNLAAMCPSCNSSKGKR